MRSKSSTSSSWGKQLVVGIDPGLRSTGIAMIRGDTLVAATTIREPAIAGGHGEALQRRRRIVSTTMIVIDARTPPGAPPPLIVIEAFEHRGWVPRRIDTGPEMGALVAELTLVAEGRGHLVVSVEPATSKAGWPKGEHDRARLMPRQLANRHERDAYLAAIAGRTLARMEDRT